MRPANSSSSSIEIWRWNSPFPYLFGGLALILGLIGVALIILSCSHKKRTPSPDHDKDKPPKTICTEPDTVPRVVVIMAGDENPTYLATPVLTSTTASDEQENGHNAREYAIDFSEGNSFSR
ncbi:hypothetical protein AAG906_013376 [Vitis piasezkii]